MATPSAHFFDSCLIRQGRADVLETRPAGAGGELVLHSPRRSLAQLGHDPQEIQVQG